jgi:hypothetical protein
VCLIGGISKIGSSTPAGTDPELLLLMWGIIAGGAGGAGGVGYGPNWPSIIAAARDWDDQVRRWSTLRQTWLGVFAANAARSWDVGPVTEEP